MSIVDAVLTYITPVDDTEPAVLETQTAITLFTRGSLKKRVLQYKGPNELRVENLTAKGQNELRVENLTAKGQNELRVENLTAKGQNVLRVENVTAMGILFFSNGWKHIFQ